MIWTLRQISGFVFSRMIFSWTALWNKNPPMKTKYRGRCQESRSASSSHNLKSKKSVFVDKRWQKNKKTAWGFFFRLLRVKNFVILAKMLAVAHIIWRRWIFRRRQIRGLSHLFFGAQNLYESMHFKASAWKPSGHSNGWFFRSRNPFDFLTDFTEDSQQAFPLQRLNSSL